MGTDDWQRTALRRGKKQYRGLQLPRSSWRKRDYGRPGMTGTRRPSGMAQANFF